MPSLLCKLIRGAINFPYFSRKRLLRPTCFQPSINHPPPFIICGWFQAFWNFQKKVKQGFKIWGFCNHNSHFEVLFPLKKTKKKKSFLLQTFDSARLPLFYHKFLVLCFSNSLVFLFYYTVVHWSRFVSSNGTAVNNQSRSNAWRGHDG